MIIQFKSSLSEPTTRCDLQNCLIEDGDWIKLKGKDKKICMFCDDEVRKYVRNKEFQELHRG